MGFLAGGIGLAVLALIVANAAQVQPWLTAFGLATTVAILAGVRLHRPSYQLPWLLLAGCDFVTTIGLVFEASPGTLGTIGQALTGIGSLVGFVGFVLLVRSRIPSGDRAALLDAAIVSAGAGVLIWAFGFAPYIVAAGQGSIIAPVFFFPSLVALALVARMWFFAGPHRPVTRLIALNVVAANGIILLEIVRGTMGPDAFTGPGLLLRFLQLAFTGAAALHPAMSARVEHAPSDNEPIGRRRFIALGLALLVNPATLAIEVAMGRRIDPAPYAVGGAVIGLLVIVRLGDALGKLRDSLAERDSLLGQVTQMAFHDALTGLPNRSLFSQRLTASVNSREVDGLLATLMVDLDDFKAVNDNYGHDAGDALLIAVGERLEHAVREGDTVARLGGDEFVISLPGCTDQLVPIQVARRILAAIAEPFEVDGHSLIVHASVGVAIAGVDDESATDLVRKADVAMYVAKGRGKGRFDVFEPTMKVTPVIPAEVNA